jgi:acyl-CoA thioester hydrolase
MKTTETKIQVRFGDVDQMGHVNNARQMEFLDLGKADFSRRIMMHEAQVEDITPIVAAIKVDFLEQIFYRDDIWVRTWVERVGNKSATMRQQIFVKRAGSDVSPDSDQNASPKAGSSADVETICTDSQTVMVAYNRATGQSVEFPDVWRRRVLG